MRERSTLRKKKLSFTEMICVEGQRRELLVKGVKLTVENMINNQAQTLNKELKKLGEWYTSKKCQKESYKKELNRNSKGKKYPTVNDNFH